MDISEIVETYPELIARFLNSSGTSLLLVMDGEYGITFCNDALIHKLHLPDKPIGASLGSVLCSTEDGELSLNASNSQNRLVPQMLRLCNTNDLYCCYVLALREGYLLLGDKMGSTQNEVLESMSHLNNELSAMSRELSKKNRELERANEKIRQLSRTDALTGLANRGHFQERFQETFSLTKRHGLELTLLLADLDHFKRVNDSYGHNVGDEVLRAFGSILTHKCRTEDLPARYGGGEEFIVMLPETPATGAAELYDRLREELIHSDLLPDSDYITFSAGIAEYAEGDTETSLLKKADDAMYLAKDAGRDRCMVSS